MYIDIEKRGKEEAPVRRTWGQVEGSMFSRSPRG